MDGFSEAFGLIGGQGVHRVDDDRLDTRAGIADAVIKRRVEKTLGLAGTRARCNQGGSRSAIGGESLPGLLLVPVRWIIGLQSGKEIRFDVAPLKWQIDRQIGAFEETPGGLSTNTSKAPEK